MKVRIVRTQGNVRPEPPLDPAWPDIVKLDWKAGCVTADTGLDITVEQLTAGLFGRDYSIAIKGEYGGISAGPFGYNSAWTYLNGISAGARASGARPKEGSMTTQFWCHLLGHKYPKHRLPDEPPQCVRPGCTHTSKH